MTTIEKTIHHLALSLLFTLINWFIIDFFIIKIPFFKYFIIEIILVLSLKFYKFTLTKLKIIP
jgi:hypothetical protein